MMRSPLKDSPLRNPGQSLEERLVDSQFEYSQYIAVAVFFIALACIEWWKQYANIPPTPITYTVMALAGVAFAAIKLRPLVLRSKNDELGRDGERCVGQFLEKLRTNGAQVFHDVPGDGFNLDHVIVSETGIYVIETKTLSKPDSGPADIEFDGERITKNGFELDRNPIDQVTAASTYLRNIISESTGRDFKIQPIVTFPGWFVKPATNKTQRDIWVLNPKAIPSFISNSRSSISSENVHLTSYHLSRYIRTYKDSK